MDQVGQCRSGFAKTGVRAKGESKVWLWQWEWLGDLWVLVSGNCRGQKVPGPSLGLATVARKHETPWRGGGWVITTGLSHACLLGLQEGQE